VALSILKVTTVFAFVFQSEQSKPVKLIGSEASLKVKVGLIKFEVKESSSSCYLELTWSIPKIIICELTLELKVDICFFS